MSIKNQSNTLSSGQANRGENRHAQNYFIRIRTLLLPRLWYHREVIFLLENHQWKFFNTFKLIFRSTADEILEELFSGRTLASSTLLYDKNMKPPSIIPNRMKDKLLNIFGIRKMYKVGSHSFQLLFFRKSGFEPSPYEKSTNWNNQNNSRWTQRAIEYFRPSNSFTLVWWCPQKWRSLLNRG